MQSWLTDELSDEQKEAVKRIQPSYPFVDANGKTLSRDEALARARKYITRHASIEDIVDSYLDHAFDDEIMQWIVDPETGEFGED